MPKLSFDVFLHTSFDEAVEQVTAALKEEGFGVLTRINVHEALKEKLGVEFRPYTILGACNPKLANRALSARPEVGLLLPCNVTVEQTGAAECVVRIIDPDEMMKAGGFDSDEAIASVGEEAGASLRRVAEALGG
jgi:uncharacterized protein (DUF302 family)